MVSLIVALLLESVCAVDGERTVNVTTKKSISLEITLVVDRLQISALVSISLQLSCCLPKYIYYLHVLLTHLNLQMPT